jgi:hypothetical protein
MISRQQFSKTQSLDLRTAMAAALCRKLQSELFPGPGGIGTTRLEVAYQEWPSFGDEVVTPAACVLPDGEGRDVEARLTPSLLEDTWENEGEPGYGLYVLSDYECEFLVKIRAATSAERSAVIAGVEQMFVQDPDILIAPVGGNRYGMLARMDEYYQRECRFGLLGTTVIDDQGTAMREQRDAQFRIQAQAQKVRVGLVQPFTVRVFTDIDSPLADLAITVSKLI